MCELLTKEQIETIFTYLRNYTNDDMWKELETYCSHIRGLRVTGACSRQGKDGVSYFLNALEQNIGSLDDYCSSRNIDKFSFEATRSVEIPKKNLTHKRIVKTICYGKYIGIDEQSGIWEQQECMTDTENISEYVVYLKYEQGEIDNYIELYIETIDNESVVMKEQLNNDMLHIITPARYIKSISHAVCEKNKSSIFTVYAVYTLDVEE